MKRFSVSICWILIAVNKLVIVYHFWGCCFCSLKAQEFSLRQLLELHRRKVAAVLPPCSDAPAQRDVPVKIKWCVRKIILISFKLYFKISWTMTKLNENKHQWFQIWKFNKKFSMTKLIFDMKLCSEIISEIRSDEKCLWR